VDGRLLIRFKKFDGSETPHNIQTGQQAHIAYQDQLDFPEFPPAATWVTFGYRLAPAGEAIRSIVLTCHYAYQLIWRFLVHPTDSKGGELFPFRPVAPPPAPPDGTPLERPPVRARKGKDKQA
jgi:hypothetical protein